MIIRLLESSPDVLLHQAKGKEARGEYAESLKLLRRALSIIARQGKFYPAEVFTRLPLLLQKSGATQEGWEELRFLLKHGCPGRKHVTLKATQWADRAVICDKARLFLQRNHEHDRALLYGVQCYLCRWLAFHQQGRFDQLVQMRSRAALRGLLVPLLENAEKMSLEEELIGEMKQALDHQSSRTQSTFLARVATLIAVHNLHRNPVLVGA